MDKVVDAPRGGENIGKALRDLQEYRATNFGEGIGRGGGDLGSAPTLPGTGPNGTQIIPPSASPTAPTLPGTGPNGTQIIPPGPTAPTQPMICPGPGCPPSPYDKTEAGFGALLNALGQKGGS